MRCFSGHEHPSKMESQYCNWLLARKQNREIIDYKYLSTVDLHINGKLWRKWTIDFKVIENDGEEVYHEVKGYNLSDENFKLKISAFRLEYPHIKIYVNKILVMGDKWKRPRYISQTKRKKDFFKKLKKKKKDAGSG